jgi:hypothetical protein
MSKKASLTDNVNQKRRNLVKCNLNNDSKQKHRNILIAELAYIHIESKHQVYQTP